MKDSNQPNFPKLTPAQERLLIDRYNELLSEGGHKFVSLTFSFLLALYAEKISDGTPTLSESYAIGFDNLQLLIDIPFH